jgi:ribosomal protein S18 acetylase RimI-like enzyme
VFSSLQKSRSFLHFGQREDKSLNLSQHRCKLELVNVNEKSTDSKSLLKALFLKEMMKMNDITNALVIGNIVFVLSALVATALTVAFVLFGKNGDMLMALLLKPVRMGKDGLTRWAGPLCAHRAPRCTLPSTMRITAYAPDEHRDAVGTIAAAYPDVFGQEDLRLLAVPLQGTDDHQLLWIALDDAHDTVLGFVGLGRYPDSPVSWAVTWLAVAPTARRQGVASALLHHVEEEAQARDLPQLFVETCSCKASAPSRELYEQHGYRAVGRLPGYYEKSGHHSKVVSVKRLPPRPWKIRQEDASVSSAMKALV